MAEKKHPILLWLIAANIFVITCDAQRNYEHPIFAPLQGPSFAVGAYAEVVDDKLGTTFYNDIENTYREKGVVSLHVKENSQETFPSGFYCEVSVSIDWWDDQNNQHTENKTLAVSFRNDTLHNDTLISYYSIEGAHKIRATINNIYTEGLSTPLPDIFVLQSTLLFQRDYEFSCTQYPSLTDTSYLDTQDELEIHWQTLGTLLTGISGIDFPFEHEFDVEWTFYDDSSDVVKNGVSYNSSLFRRNATRIVISKYPYDYCRIPLLYETGYLFFRIRSVKVLPSGQRIAGVWTSDQFAGDPRFIYKVSGHEHKLNWQAATTFAEEGKHKSVVSYFDGSSKNRQTVTKINTDKIAVVAETIYDFEGRPVVSTLPSPAFDSILHHHDLYNQNILGSSYSWHDLDSAGIGCIAGPRVMNNAIGSSKYYSLNNPLRDVLPHSNIPEAFGFPFSETAYTGDLTNRIRASAGPGKDHNFGAPNQRYTKYLYGIPSPSQLTSMFGTEVGHVSHYFKNLVIDPNGQVSVTYQDMHGRTIATALSGDTISVDLQKLDENSDTVMMKDAIIDTSTQIIEDLSIKTSKTFLVSRKAVHEFSYSLLPEEFKIKTCDSSDFCYDCVYDLNIRVTDECNNYLYDTTIRNYTPSDALGYYYDTSCANLPLPLLDSFALVLDVGEYTVSKSLTIQKEAIEFYFSDYVSKDTCIKTFDDFYADALNNVDLSGCNVTCQSCREALGDTASFIQQFMAEIHHDDSLYVFTSNDTMNAIASYIQLADICDRMCDSFSICDAKLNLMLQDMSPRGGQYAGYTYHDDNDTYEFTDPTSILTHNPSPGIYPQVGQNPPAIYTLPGIVYRDELGIPDTIWLDTDNDGEVEPFLPNDLADTNFVKLWNPSWAQSLLPYHPEYCDYIFCVNNTASHDYDQAMLQTENYDSAVLKGFLNPLNYYDPMVVPFGFSNNPDPFFTNSGYGGVYGYSSYMANKMKTYVDYTDHSTYPSTTIQYSLWELASMSAGCLGNTSCDNCTKNFYWNTFRDTYLGLKRIFYDEAMIRYYENECGHRPYSNLTGPLNSNGKTPRFEILNQIIADSLNAVANYNGFMPSDTDHLQQIAQDGINGNRFHCSQYAGYWWNQIQDCGYDLQDSATIINYLIEVCEKGQDDMHMYGASTTPNGVLTAHGFNSFDGVLSWASHNLQSSNNYGTTDCSHFLINNPQPYNVVTLYYQTAQVEKPAQCICDNIGDFQLQYLHSGLAGSMSFGNYLTNVRNVIITDDDIQILLDACNQNLCNILPKPVTLPYQFACDQVCVSCEQITNAYEAFKIDFPDAPLSPNHMTLLQAYMNSSLGMNLTALEYLDFLSDSCGYHNYPTVGDSLSTIHFRKMSVPENTQSKKDEKTKFIPFVTDILGKSNSGNNYLADVQTGVLSKVIDYKRPVNKTSTAFDQISKGWVKQHVATTNSHMDFLKNLEPELKPVPKWEPVGEFLPFASVQSKRVTETSSDKVFKWPVNKSRISTDGEIGKNRHILHLLPSSTIRSDAFRMASSGLFTGSFGSAKQLKFSGISSPISPGTTHVINQEVSHSANEGRLRSTKAAYVRARISSIPKLERTIVPQVTNLIDNHNLNSKSDHKDVCISWLIRGVRLSKESNNIWQQNDLNPDSKFVLGRRTCEADHEKTADRDCKSSSRRGRIWLISESRNSNFHRKELSLENGTGNSVFTNLGSQESVLFGNFAKLPLSGNSSDGRRSPSLVGGSIIETAFPGKQHRNSQETFHPFFSIQQQSNWCDSVRAAIADYDTTYVYQGDYNVGNFLSILNYDLGVSYDFSTWLQIMDSCNLPCPSIVRCSRADSVLSQFRNEYPQFANNSLPMFWTNYLNDNDASGNGYSYDVDTWTNIFNCCSLIFPSADTLSSRCDTIQEIINFYAGQGPYQVVERLNQLYGSYHYDSNNGLNYYNDIPYWLAQFDSCNISCSSFINCAQLSSVMQQFRNQYPQYANNCLPSIWANYLNENNASGTWTNYDSDFWLHYLNCCNVSYPAADSLGSRCDTIQSIVNFYQPQGLGTVTNQLSNQLGWSHYDSITNQWIYHDQAYWLAQFDSCNISCSAFINCAQLSSVMQQFRNEYPQYANNCLPSFWVNYLNQNNGAGDWSNYDYNNWVQFLNCCNVSYPAADSLGSRCDTIQSIVNFYQSQGLWYVTDRLNNQFGSYHYEYYTNQWLYNDQAYWLAQFDSCSISCSAFINCAQLSNVMQQFRDQYPQYANNCLPSFWVNYLNQNNGAGDWSNYDYNNWVQFLNCCNVSYPAADSLGSRCDTIQSVAGVFQSYGLSYVVDRLNDLFSWGHYDYNTNQWIYHNQAYWLAQFDSCNISCSAFINCLQLSSVMQQFRDQYPQYANNCLPSLWVNYLNQNNGAGDWSNYDYNNWIQFMNCCNVSYPAADSLGSRCDTIQTIVNFYQSQGIGTVTNELGNQLGWQHYDYNTNQWIYHDQSYWLAQFDSCGISCSAFINCSQLSSVMQQFRDQYPQYANNCLPSFWVNYLNQNNGSGNGNGYDYNTWVQFLNCCNVSYPAADSLGSRCDTIQTIVTFYQNQGLGYVVDRLNEMFNWGHYDYNTNQWIYHDQAYWLSEFDSCNIPCSGYLNCVGMTSMMQQFRDQYPQYANNCIPSIWVSYLNQNNAMGDWSSYDYEHWVGFLSCCGVDYPEPDTLTSKCDSINAIVNFFDSQGFGNTISQLNELFGWQHYDSNADQWIYHNEVYWIGELDSCNIPCSEIINCSRIDSVMQQFRNSYPQYANNCLSFLWVNYLNQNNGSGTWSSYDYNTWIEFLNCCNITYPVSNTAANRCDSIRVIADFYHTGGLGTITYQLNTLFGWDEYDTITGQWIYHDQAYWLAQFDSCNIPCSVFINCPRIDDIMQQFRNQYPQFSNSCMSSIWVDYLNQNNASGDWSYYDLNTWIQFLNCCGISYPTDISLGNFCDSLTYMINVFNSSSNSSNGWDQLVYQLNNVWGYAHWDDYQNQWVQNDQIYWKAKIDSCNAPCPHIINCANANNVMQQFYMSHPMFADSCPPNIWVDYLNQHNASGNGWWYSFTEWQGLLQCCGISYPNPDTLTDCEMLAVAINSFNNSPYRNLWSFQNMMGSMISYGYNDQWGNWVSYDYHHWFNLIDSCNLPCPNIINCVSTGALLGQLYSRHPDLQDTCPEFVWVNYLNQNNAGNGSWYDADQWRTMLKCCDINVPANDTLNTFCDSVSLLVSIGYDSSSALPLVGVINQIAPTFYSYYHGPTNDHGDIPLSFWLEILDSCGYTCGQFSNCSLLDSVLNDFTQTYPQYADSCPSFVITAYLNYHILGNTDKGGTYEELSQVYACCGLTLPVNDSTPGKCDTAYMINNYFSYLHFLLIDSLHAGCIPAWVYNLALHEDMKLQVNLSDLCGTLDSCGYSCPDTCVLLTFCDSLHSIVQIYNLVYQQHDRADYVSSNQTAAGQGGDMTLVGFVNMVLDTNFTEQQLNSLLVLCDSALCDSLSPLLAMLQPLFASYDSCIPSIVISGAFNTVSGLTFNNEQWCNILSDCGFSCPDTCTGSTHTFCDTVLAAYDMYLHVINTYQVDDSLQMLGNIFSAFLGRNISGTAALDIYKKCDTLCNTVHNVYNSLQPLFNSYGSCVPAWVVELAYNVNLGAAAGHLNYGQICELLHRCNLPCPDTCGSIQPISCDSILQLNGLFQHAVELYGQFVSTNALFQMINQAFWSRQLTLPEFNNLVDSCRTCDSLYVNIYNEYSPFFNGFGNCTPSWAVEFIYSALLNHPVSYGDVCQNLGRCGFACPDTCHSRVYPCDTILQINDAMNSVFQNYGNADSTYLLAIFSGYLLGDTLDLETFYHIVDSCKRDSCDPNLQMVYEHLNVLFSNYGNCVPSWVVELAYNANLHWLNLSGTYNYAQICQLLSTCNLPCPDTCGSIPPISCDSVLSVYGLWQNIVSTFGPEDSVEILYYIEQNVLDTVLIYPDFMQLVHACDTNHCDSLIHATYDFYQPLLSGFDSCVPAWVVKAIFKDAMQMHGIVAGNNYSYGRLCQLLADCGIPCPDTCLASPLYCDSVDRVFETLNAVFAHYDDIDTNDFVMNVTYSGLGISLNWNQFLSVYQHCHTIPGPLLCNRPLMPPVNPTEEDSCFEIMEEYAYQDASWAYTHYLYNLHENFVNGYVEKCLGAYRLEKFDYSHPNGEYHFTLYYYDQAGNLVKTIPPAGYDTTGHAQHQLPTVYRYNTLNQVVEQHTPDAGNSQFWYDRIGKLVVSQNQKQYHRDEISYTLYDKLQRILEVGSIDGIHITNYDAFDNLALLPNDATYHFLVYEIGNTPLHIPEQITRTYYDYDVFNQGGQFLRNRVASATYEDVEDFDPATYNYATHYWYDIHGNVRKLIQDNPRLAAIGHDKKTIEYDYDLISGKVNEVLYQRGQPDQFIHKYEYDGDNRITDVLTSRDSTVFTHDAFYQYYLHGPLARTQLGGNLYTGAGSVQGLDYAYTLQGWLKGINSSGLTTGNDPGRDGIGGFTAPDQFGFTLGYYIGDFQPIAWGHTINASNHIEADITNLNQSSLYNGNIASIAVNISKLSAPLANKYRYDLLNRIVGADAFDGLDAAQNQWTNNAALTAYHNEFRYDPNGNILSNLRKGATGNEDMDDLSYKYLPGTNKLDHVDDAVAATNYTVDIDDQDTTNYLYDSIGNLTKDKAEGLDTILWNVYGKIWEIHKTNGDTIRFAYDATGNRIMKELWRDSLHLRKQTFYVRDATGNIMATYNYQADTLMLDELVMYGSSRIGVVSPKLQLYPALPTPTDPLITGVNYYLLNQKQYELSNHLGNVQVTVGDRRLPQYNSGIFDHYEAEVAYASDYYAFGMVMPGREYYNGRYRFGYNGKEKDDEVKGDNNSLDFGARIYDSRLGRFLTVDLFPKNSTSESDYIFAGNSSIKLIDKNGEFKLDPEMQKHYPMVYKYLANQIERDVTKGSKIISSYCRLFKGLDEAGIREVFKTNSGPSLISMDYPGQQSSVGHYEPDDRTIEINTKVFDYVEKSLKSKTLSKEEKQKSLMLLYVAVLHESSHDFATRFQPTDDKNTVHYEDGLDMEYYSFGIERGKKPENKDLPNIISGVESANDKLKQGVLGKAVDKAKQSEEGKKALPTVVE